MIGKQNMTELCEIAFKYKTDKCPQIKHHFTEFYYEMFKDNRDNVKKVLEIGVGMMHPYYARGASLYMWREWFPNAMIYGIDIEPDLIFSDDRIKTFLCDQRDEFQLKTMIRKIGDDIDLFIDDGSHLPEVQMATCFMAMPLLKDPIYVIEDVGNRWIVDHLSKAYDCKVLKLNRRKYNDDCLVVVRKK